MKRAGARHRAPRRRDGRPLPRRCRPLPKTATARRIAEISQAMHACQKEIDRLFDALDRATREHEGLERRLRPGAGRDRHGRRRPGRQRNRELI
ncbi:MAG: hypothetical protein MZV70_20505 [Desulfobacterales bacterium]|nr:hypothetical protein [Desulfobacterales bacterium]